MSAQELHRCSAERKEREGEGDAVSVAAAFRATRPQRSGVRCCGLAPPGGWIDGRHLDVRRHTTLGENCGGTRSSARPRRCGCHRPARESAARCHCPKLWTAVRSRLDLLEGCSGRLFQPFGLCNCARETGHVLGPFLHQCTSLFEVVRALVGPGHRGADAVRQDVSAISLRVSVPRPARPAGLSEIRAAAPSCPGAPSAATWSHRRSRLVALKETRSRRAETVTRGSPGAERRGSEGRENRRFGPCGLSSPRPVSSIFRPRSE